jgi:hypothetical protein
VDQLQTRLEALEQQMRTINRRLRWWRGLACGVVVLAVLTWALPSGTAQEEADERGQKGLAQRVAALEKLLKHFSREGNEITITGANLHIVNGLGNTDCDDEQGRPIPECPNGLGNLIVGYNESRASVGETDIRTGSHNVVVGQRHNFSRFGGIVIGDLNEISGDFASVSGGFLNTASGFASAISGGQANRAIGEFAWVSGGVSNTASGMRGAVSGGQGNSAEGLSSSVSGGLENTASGAWSAVSGGFQRVAPGEFDWVAGTLFEDE